MFKKPAYLFARVAPDAKINSDDASRSESFQLIAENRRFLYVRSLKPNLGAMRIGFTGSPTWVKKTFIPSHSRDGLVIEKQATDSAKDILDFILEKALFRL